MCSDLRLRDFDAIVTLYERRAMEAMWLPMHGASPPPPHLHIASIGDVFHGVFHRQLRDAACCAGRDDFEEADVKGQFKACDKSDVHYAQPGLPDYVLSMWMMLLASGIEGQWTGEGTSVPDAAGAAHR